MLVKIAELMEQTNNPTIFNALKTAFLETCVTMDANNNLAESKHPPMLGDEISAGLHEGKLAAVKMYKNRTLLGLMDSKKAVEYQFQRAGYKFK